VTSADPSFFDTMRHRSLMCGRCATVARRLVRIALLILIINHKTKHRRKHADRPTQDARGCWSAFRYGAGRRPLDGLGAACGRNDCGPVDGARNPAARRRGGRRLGRFVVPAPYAVQFDYALRDDGLIVQNQFDIDIRSGDLVTEDIAWAKKMYNDFLTV
jgi:hypothetical protein